MYTIDNLYNRVRECEPLRRIYISSFQKKIKNKRKNKNGGGNMAGNLSYNQSKERKYKLLMRTLIKKSSNFIKNEKSF